MPGARLVRHVRAPLWSFVSFIFFASFLLFFPSLTEAQQPTAIFTAGSTHIGPPVTVSGPVFSQADLAKFAVQGNPPPRHHPLLPGPSARPRPETPLNAEALPSPVPPSEAFGPQAASDFIVKRDTALTGTPFGFAATIAEPSVGGAGQAIFQTYNWYAATSPDNGATWSYINPFTLFPTTGNYSGGFCCDQHVVSDTSRNLVIWYLQYHQTGSTATDVGGDRLAIAHGAADLASNTWQTYDILPGAFAPQYATGYWLDFPQIAISSNYLYITSNIYTTTVDQFGMNQFAAAGILRIPLDALENNTPFTADTFVSTTDFSYAPVSGATNTMYFATNKPDTSPGVQTSVGVFSWPESSTALSESDFGGLSATYDVLFSCPAFDGTDPCYRDDTRIFTGWVNTTEVGFAWGSGQNPAAGRPYPFTRVLILNPQNLSVSAQPDVWNQNYACLYLSVATNGRGHLGGAIDLIGGNQGANVASTYVGVIRDDFTAAGTWDLSSIATSDAGSFDYEWGDYNAAAMHPAYQDTWLIGGHVQSGGANDYNSVVHSSWIMRSRDDPTVSTASVDRTSLNYTATTTGTAFAAQTGAQLVRLVHQGAGPMTWTASSDSPWLVVSPTSGSGSAVLTVTVQFVPGVASSTGSITIALTGTSNSLPPIAVTLRVFPAGSTAAPFGSFDTPINLTTGVSGSIAVTGWALDDVQVTRVTVCRDPVPAEQPAPLNGNCAGNARIYIGDAVFIDGARPDVEAGFPTLPLNSRAGWGYLMLTNFLPGLGNGTFNLRAYAYDAEGLTTALGVKTITCDNQHSFFPFGAIDTPGQGAVVSGASFLNFGWVLSQMPTFADPPDGGTVNVFIDGTIVGSPGAWGPRSDLTSLFPASQYPGISHALGVFAFDTTTLSNGLHTIFWVVTGFPGGGTSGVGSRFFTVSNGAEVLNPAATTSSAPVASVIESSTTLDMPPAAASRVASGPMLASAIAAAPPDLGAVQGRRGFDLALPLRSYPPSSGAIDVQAEELDRIELHLSGTGQHHYTGYLQTANGLKPLPVGSSLDAPTGTFTWAAGAGFYGTYNLTFVRWSGANAVARRDVRITLNAKGSNRVGPQTIIDAPVSGASVGSPFLVGGWAADLDSPTDTGVDTVHVWAYPVDASGKHLDPIFIGQASYGGARPDVAAVYGDRFGTSGYGIIVNGLQPRTYDLAVFAFSTVVNNFTPANVVRVTVR